LSAAASKPVAVVAPYDEVTEEDISKRPTRKAPPPPQPPTSSSRLLKHRSGGGGGDPDQGSQHSYEEIAASEAATIVQHLQQQQQQQQQINQQHQQPQDLSPIYEEIPGGSRSSVSSGGSGSGRSLTSPRLVIYIWVLTELRMFFLSILYIPYSIRNKREFRGIMRDSAKFMELRIRWRIRNCELRNRNEEYFCRQNRKTFLL
jgi:hypothetical protein